MKTIPSDLAIDYNTGDLRISSDNGLDIRTGRQTIEQRIRVRLRIYQGAWELDPTGGALGSNLHEILRMPQWRAVGEAELSVREALATMDDIRVQQVQVQADEDNPKAIKLSIEYFQVEPTGDVGIDLQQTTITVTG